MQTVLDLNQEDLYVSLLHTIADAWEFPYSDRDEFEYAAGLYEISKYSESNDEMYVMAHTNVCLLLNCLISKENEDFFSKIETNNEIIMRWLCMLAGSDQGILGGMLEGVTFGLIRDKTQNIVKGRQDPSNFEEEMAQTIWKIWKEDVRDNLLNRDALRQETFQLAMAEKITELNHLKDTLIALQKEYEKSQSVISRLLGRVKSDKTEIINLKKRISELEEQVQVAY